MEKNNQNSPDSKLIKEAISDYKRLMAEASEEAKAELAKTMPKDFEKILKEYVDKKYQNKESVNESVKDKKKKESINENILDNDNPDMYNESDNDIDDIDLTDMSEDEVEGAFNDANASDEFEVSNDDEIDLSQIENELNKIEEMSDELEDQPEGNEKPVEQQGDDTDPYNVIKEMHSKLSEIIEGMENKKMHEKFSSEFESTMKEMFGDKIKESLGDDKYNEMYETYVSSKSQNNEGVYEQEDEMEDISESKADEDKPKEDKKGKNPFADEDEKDVDESNITHAHNKLVQGHNTPQPEYRQHAKERQRYALQKENYEKRIGGLLKENKELSKRTKELKSDLNDKVSLVNEQIDVLKKYKNQLQEMAIYNTSLAHVNSILVEADLNSDQKMEVIQSFKNVKSLTESEKIYKQTLSSFKEKKNNLQENIENKLNNSVIGKSSSDEVVNKVNETTAYKNNNSLNEIKNRINYLDNRWKKNQ